VALIRRGSTAAFEVLVSRYHTRLLAFCRHLLGSREDAEDVLQEVFSAAFNALLDDDRPINVRPWLYRIARNRSLNHLRRIQAVGVDSMDIHLSEHGTTTADKVHDREEFRLLVGDIHALPETQRTALVLREMDALSYEQIAEAMETTVPSVKSLLVRARVSLAEAAEARLLTCEQVRVELAEIAEGLQRRPGPLVRRHLRSCERCSTFKGQLNDTSKALTAVLPVGGFVLLRKLAILHIGHSAGAGAGAGSGASGGTAAAVGGTAAAGATAVMGTTSTGFLSASIGAIATKAAAGLAAAALVTAGAVEVEQPARPHARHHAAATTTQAASVPSPATVAQTVTQAPAIRPKIEHRAAIVVHKPVVKKAAATTTHKPAVKTLAKKDTATIKAGTKANPTPALRPGRIQTQTNSTVLAGSTIPAATTTPAGTSTGCPATSSDSTTTAPTTTSTASTSTPATGSTTSSTSTDPTTTSTSPATTTPGASTDTGPASSCSGDSSAAGSPSGVGAGSGTSSTTTSTTTTTTTAATTSTSTSSRGTASAGSALASGGVTP